MSTVSPEKVRGDAEQRGLIVENVKEIDFGYRYLLKAIYLKTNIVTALYTRKKLNEIEHYNKKIIFIANVEHFWNSVDWFIPPYISIRNIDQAIKQTGINMKEYKQLDKKILQKRFESFFSIYNLNNIIPFTIQTLATSEAISKHLPIIRESILAFFSGMRVVAIAALIPIIENILDSIVGKESSILNTIEKVERYIKLAKKKVINLHIKQANWIPSEYIKPSVIKVMNKRIFMLDLIEYWLTKSFYSKTSEYKNYSGLNRNHFAHARSDIWQNQSNFF